MSFLKTRRFCFKYSKRSLKKKGITAEEYRLLILFKKRTWQVMRRMVGKLYVESWERG